MNIAKALKEKNKRISLIKDLSVKLMQHNSLPKGDEREYDSRDLVEKITAESRALAELKAKIHVASQPVREKIFILAELKSAISTFKKVPTKNGTERHYRGDAPIEMVAQLKSKDFEVIISDLEKEIETIQEELDKFNNITEI